MKGLEEYEDALLTMQLAVAMENRIARIERRNPKPNTVLKACCKVVCKRLKEHRVWLVVMGIHEQKVPSAALTKTVREYLAVKKQLEEKGYVYLHFEGDK